MHDVGNKFKAENGIYFTKQLFYEMADEKDSALYTLKDYHLVVNGKTYPSILRLFVDEGDETGYLFALKHFDSWKHFKKLMTASWFASVIEEARDELSARREAQSLLEVAKKANSGDLKANQYLLDRGFKKKDPVGRPSKARIREEAERIFQDTADISDDAARILEFKRA